MLLNLFYPCLGSSLLRKWKNYVLYLTGGPQNCHVSLYCILIGPRKNASVWLVDVLVELGIWLQPKTLQNPFTDRSWRPLLSLSAFISAGEGWSPRDGGFDTLLYVNNMVYLLRARSDHKLGFWRWLWGCRGRGEAPPVAGSKMHQWAGALLFREVKIEFPRSLNRISSGSVEDLENAG